VVTASLVAERGSGRGRPCRWLFAGSGEPVEPRAGDGVQGPGFEPVDALAPVHGDGDQPGLLQDPQVPGGRRPGAVEPGRDRPGRHLPAAGVQHGEDGAAGAVGQGREDGVEGVEFGKAPGTLAHPGRLAAS